MKEKPTILTGNAQRIIFDNLDKLVFNVAYAETSRRMKMSLATLYDAWRTIQKNNKVEIKLVLNGKEIGSCPTKRVK
jgi:hypothetical protein